MKNNVLIRIMAFISLFIIAFLTFLTQLLPFVGLDVSGPLIPILSLINQIFIMFILAFVGFEFVANKRKGWKVIYWIAVAVYLVSIILGIIDVIKLLN